MLTPGASRGRWARSWAGAAGVDGRERPAVWAPSGSPPPRLAPLTEGMVDAVKGPVSVTETPRARATGPARPPRAPAAPAGPAAPRAPRRRFARPRPRASTSGPRRCAASRPRPRSLPEATRLRRRALARSLLTAPVAQAIRARWPAPDGGPRRPAPPAPGVEGRPGLRASESVAAPRSSTARGRARRRQAGGASPPGELSRSGICPNAALDADNPRPVLTPVKGDQLAHAPGPRPRGRVGRRGHRGRHSNSEVGEGASPHRGGGEGRAEGASGPPTAPAGWHAGTWLRRLSAIAFVAPGAVVTAPCRGDAPSAIADRRPVALVTAARRGPRAAPLSATRLPPRGPRRCSSRSSPPRTPTSSSRGSSWGLERARHATAPRPPDPRGRGAPRTYGVFGLEPDPGRRRRRRHRRLR